MSNKRSIGIALIGIAVLAVIAVTMHTPIEEKKTAVSSSDIKPAVIFDMGGKFDKSFNEGVWAGVKKFTEETGIEVMEFEVTNEAQREQALRRMAQRGANPVLGIGFAQAPAIEKVAKEFPDTNFAIIDMVVDLPNVRSIVFKEQEGSFLVGAMAAMASESGKVGFVGGMDIPLIRRFACGYEQGAKFANPDAEVIQNMTGSTPAAWNDPGRGGELAKSQFERGVDVIYAAAGGTGCCIAGRAGLLCESCAADYINLNDRCIICTGVAWAATVGMLCAKTAAVTLVCAKLLEKAATKSCK